MDEISDEEAEAEFERVMALPCARCGKSPAEGFATIGDLRYCHGDDDTTATCYELTLWNGELQQ